MGKFGDLIKSNDLVLVDFFATWCGPCKALSPILEDVAKKLKGKVRIVKIDVDKNKAIAAQMNVRGVPTLVLYKKGNQVWRQSGVVPAGELVKLVQQHS